VAWVDEVGEVLSLLRFPAINVRALALLVLAGVGVFGCKANPPFRPSALQDAASRSASESYPAVEKRVAEGLVASPAMPGEDAPDCPRPLEVLALSGGVEAVPFTAGVLVGWTASGTRPTFDVVAGVSSGALLGAFAFLGPKYDSNLQRLTTTLKTSDLIKIQPLRSLIRDGALGSPAPSERLIQSEINDDFLADLRQAHAAGRRFFVGTMDMETKQLVIWDMGAIASSGRPDAGDLFCKVLLAAMAWPGLLPPVEFNVEVNGRCHREQHVDAGAASMVFVRFGPMPGWPEEGESARQGWLKGSNLYVLACRKLYSDPGPAPTRAVSRVLGYLEASFEALTVANIDGLYALCAASGMRFHLLAMPQEIHDAALGFSSMFPKDSPQLFETGYGMAAKGPLWRLTPPGSEPGEEPIPRDGTQIMTCH
jgi:hypothetical protein